MSSRPRAPGCSRPTTSSSTLTRLISFYQGYVSALLAREVVGQLLAEREKVSAPQRAGAAAFQRVAHDSGAVLLSFWLTPEQSYLWVVAPAGLHLLTLPPAAEIDALVRQHQALIANVMGNPLASLNTPGDKLYEVLIKPAAQWIPKESRVIIVPDGTLHEINFETLTVPQPAHHYWIDDVQVELAPSLALLTATAPAQGERQAHAPVAAGRQRRRPWRGFSKTRERCGGNVDGGIALRTRRGYDARR